MTRCCRCGAPATFDSPRDYCDEHWARWWGGYDPQGPEKIAPSPQMYEEALAEAKKRSRAERKG